VHVAGGMRAGIAGVMLLGCACGSAAPAPSSTSVPPSHEAAVPDYEVHEWGLLRAEEGDVLRAGAVAPPALVQPMVVFKPVLYFHAAAPITLRSVVVQASSGGSLTEVWPLAPFDTSVRWDEVALDPGGPCEVSALPTAAEPPCSTLASGDLCEAAGLAVARTSDGACVTVGAAVDRFLFYRARVTSFTPPLAFERTGTADEVRITNEGAAPIPGVVVRIRSQGGVVSALVVEPPAPGASVLVGADFAGAAAATDAALEVWYGHPTAAGGRAGLRLSMLEIGLTLPEAEAFLAAWQDTLFGGPGVALDLSAQAPVDSFVYFLPEATTDGIAVVTIDPPPRVSRRALAIWSVLRTDGGPSH
jgi:hypothetical protein